MSKTIGAADLAAAIKSAVASTKHVPEPVVVGLVPPARPWPQATASFSRTRTTFAPGWRASATLARTASPREGWRNDA